MCPLGKNLTHTPLCRRNTKPCHETPQAQYFLLSGCISPTVKPVGYVLNFTYCIFSFVVSFFINFNSQMKLSFCHLFCHLLSPLCALPWHTQDIPIFTPTLILKPEYCHITMISNFQIFPFQAVETLKMFEKKDSRVKSAAATNLSFLYYLVSFGFFTTESG